MKGWLPLTGQSVHQQGSHLLNKPVTGAVKHSARRVFNNPVSQPDRQMASHSVSNATKELIRNQQTCQRENKPAKS
jgi:hypothetical protein